MKKKIVLVIGIFVLILLSLLFIGYIYGFKLGLFNKKIEDMTIKKIDNEKSYVGEFGNGFYFFDYKVDDSVKAVSIDLWEYDGKEYKKFGKVSRNFDELLYYEKEKKVDIFTIGLDINENNYNIYGDYKIGSFAKYENQLNFENMGIFTQVLEEQKIELNKEIVLFSKYGILSDNFSMGIDTHKNLKEADEAIIITVTFFDKKIEYNLQ